MYNVHTKVKKFKLKKKKFFIDLISDITRKDRE